MARKNSSEEKPERNKRSTTEKEPRSNLKRDTKRGIYAVLAFLLALLFLAAAFHKAGIAGEFIYSLFKTLFGLGYIILPLACVGLGFLFTRRTDEDEEPAVMLKRTSIVTLVLGVLAMMDVASGSEHAGGSVGKIIAYPFATLFGPYIGLAFIGGLILISIFVLFDERPNLMRFISRFSLFRKKNVEEMEISDEDEEVVEEEEIEEEEEDEEPEEKKSVIATIKDALAKESADDIVIPKMVSSLYTPPPLSLLEQDKGKPNTGDVKANANIIKRTLANFGIEVEMDEITVGPTVTRYALKPAEGVKLSRIVGLQNDLALALAAHPLRIEAPIPGKSLVGIEIPNKKKSTVGLATLLGDSSFKEIKPLLIALGRNISGKAVIRSLVKMPHLLIAGTTGSGKSVTIHAIVTSLLYRHGPAELKFIMVDPKRVELTLYNKIPHLLTPVITDSKKAILALKWAANEMSRRYDILESESVRDISSYHANIVVPYQEAQKKKKKSEQETFDDAPDSMPYIVIIIDELADIMTAYPRELESAIVRLAQMSRAVGIHLILSTQRPEVNVITGLIKANVPARIALRVPTQIDSRTILDAGGAEKLLGAGDMLCLADTQQPERLQSAFITEEEVKKVVKYLADTFRDEIIDEINLAGPLSIDKSIFESQISEGDDEDELYEDARQVVMEAGKASTSYLQRKLKVGYARAARLIDLLEDRGVVGPGDGAKPREVLEKTLDNPASDEYGQSTEE